MSAPAATLEKAVEEARNSLKAYEGMSPMGGSLCAVVAQPLRALLAALDANPGQKAEAALREIEQHDSLSEPPSHQDFPLDSCPACIARRYFAEKGER